MKPLNTNNPGCDPISSNCVIWQGPDIECINLCKGDTVSTVVNKLALELCNILDTLNIDNLDLSCLALNDCGPQDFQSLLQLLIQKVCELEGLTPDSGPCDTVSGGCPDCVVTVAECFYFTDRLGDLQTTMQLVDYVTAIGNRVCQIVGQIETINATLENHEDRIVVLENKPDPTLDLPFISPSCVLPSSPALPMDQVLIALEQQFCQLQDATGNPTDIYAALLNQCSGLTQSSQLNGDGPMSTIPGWNSTVNNLAQGVTNMWLTLCDIRAAIQSIQATCCTGTACEDLAIAMEVVLTGPDQLTFYFSGTVPAGFLEPGSGSTVVITDTLNSSKTVTIPVINYLNNASGFTVTNLAPLNTASNFVAQLNFQISDGESECGRVITDTIINDAVCPSLILTPSAYEIGFSFTYAGGTANITAVLETSGGTPIQTIVYGGAIAGSYNGVFNSALIIPGTNYRVRLEIAIPDAGSPTLCPWQPVSTPAVGCIPPTAVSALSIKV